MIEYFSNITFSRDDDKDKAIASFLRNPKLSSSSKFILIFADNKKACEELTTLLNLRGFKAHNFCLSKTDL